MFFGGGPSPPPKKKKKKNQKCLDIWTKKNLQFFFTKVFEFTWNMQNVLNRKKNKISGFSNFYFSSYGHYWSFFYHNFQWIFHNNSKIKKRKNRKMVFSFYSVHCASPIEMGSKLRGGGGADICIYLVGKKHPGSRFDLGPGWIPEYFKKSRDSGQLCPVIPGHWKDSKISNSSSNTYPW